MKTFAACLLLCLAAGVPAGAADVSPIGKVLEMIGGLQQKVISEGEASHKVFAEFSEWCEDRARQLSNSIKTSEGQMQDLKARIEKDAASMEAFSTKIEELATSIASDQAELDAATKVRENERKDFVAEEAELMQVVDALSRAIAILEREMDKAGGASLVQVKSAGSLAQALAAMVQASVISSTDASRLTGLLQQQRQAQQANEDADDEDDGAPDASVYEGQSGGIIDTLQDLLDKAEKQLDGLRKAETTSKNNFEILEQSLNDAMKFSSQDMEEAKKGLATSTGSKAKAEGDLAATSKDLQADKEAKAQLHSDCMEKAEDFEAETKSRSEELKALAEAKKVLQDTTAGAADQTYSLLQVASQGRSGGRAETQGVQVVRFVRRLATEQNSTALAQLAMRMTSAIRVGSKTGDDIFAKVKSLISDLIKSLEMEAAADVKHKEYCDRQLGDNEEKEEDKQDEIGKMTSKIDEATSGSEKLKEEVAGLQKGLAALAASEQEMSRLRAEEKALYDGNKPEMEKGLEGVKLALKILGDYYASEGKAHSSADGAGAGILGLLEVIESDLSKGLAEMVAAEEEAVAEYESESNENAIEKTQKSQDVKYKSQEALDLDKAVAEAKADRSGVQKELGAVQSVLKSLHDECDGKVEPYEEMQRRRAAEVAGLKSALHVLEGEAVLLQKRGGARRLRAHAAA
ncbi:unnamed protein product [Prorocentrum cordatum]|uniref:Uncharacterized protein n=1 Tax=Prorocentrum cordatum TaxID=2364126 RepID=A0ABN9U1D3_9DINO|nr:unnamed protein product [Polarella glacialis]CAK0852596.1 unnamed protein product [Polarella glacialis]